jgi:hypothetical protein
MPIHHIWALSVGGEKGESVKRVNSNQPKCARFGLFHHTRTHTPIHTDTLWFLSLSQCVCVCAAFPHPAIKFRNLNLRSPKFALRRRLSFTRCACWDNPVHTHTHTHMHTTLFAERACEWPLLYREKSERTLGGKEPRVCWWWR